MSMTPETIGVLEGSALAEFAAIVAAAAAQGRKLRVCVDGGVKADAGAITWGWTPPMGRLGNVTGQ
jgi:hypothetical protein